MAYWFKVTHPNASENIPQLRSQCLQKPFFFGGSQIPSNLGLTKQAFSGAGFVGDAPPKSYPVSRDGKPMYHILKYPNAVGSGIAGVRLPLKR